MVVGIFVVEDKKVRYNIYVTKEKIKGEQSVSMGIPEYEINSFSDFNEQISNAYKEGYTFYRGDKVKDNNEENLLFTSFDKKKDGKFIFEGKDCDNLINDFMSIALSKMSYIPTNYFEKMLTAQHYGIPTRLQDWSESPLVALFFATSNSKELKEDDYCVMWCLNPLKLNAKTKRIVSDLTNNTYIPNISLDASREIALGYIDSFYGLEPKAEHGLFPIAIRTYKINPRIEAQKGVFLIYPRERKSLIEFEDVDQYLIKLIIKKSVAEELENLLAIYKINNYQLFPEISSIALDVKKGYER